MGLNFSPAYGPLFEVRKYSELCLFGNTASCLNLVCLTGFSVIAFQFATLFISFGCICLNIILPTETIFGLLLVIVGYLSSPAYE